MNYCSNCGARLQANENYCSICGEKISADTNRTEYNSPTDMVSSNNNAKTEQQRQQNKGSISNSTSNKSIKKPHKWLYIVGTILIPYITFFIILIKKPFSKKNNRALLVICIIWSLVIIPNGLSSPDNKDISSPTLSNKVTQEKTLSSTINGVDDNIIAQNISKACEQIGLDLAEAKEIGKSRTWAGGDVYSLTYKSNAVEIYVNGDKTINSINVGETRVYKQGLEPLSVSDYLLSADIMSQLQMQAEKTVTSALNYPSTAKFSWLDWGYGRAKDIYMVSGTVTAQNAFGVKGEMKFYIEYKIDGNVITAKYFVLDGKAIIGSKSVIEKPDRAEIPIESNVQSGSFELIDGALGEYGKKLIEDDYEYIAYYVPAGDYTVTTDMNFCVVYVEKNTSYKNSEGYIEHEIVSDNRFENGVKSLDINVGKDEHVTLTVNAKVTFAPHK